MKHSINPAPKVIIEIEGKEYQCHRPKMGAVRAFEENLAAANAAGNGVSGVLMDYIIGAGLPKEIVEDLDPSQLEQVCEVLTAAKKPLASKPTAPQS